MAPSFLQIMVVAVVVLVLFGRGKISALMGDVGKGISSFKKGISEGAKELEEAGNDVAEDLKDVTPVDVVDDKTDKV